MWPPLADEEAHRLLQPILERGQAAMRAHFATLPPAERFLAGGSVPVVLREDFVAHADICLRHVVNNERSLYVLAPNGSLCALVSRATWRR